MSAPGSPAESALPPFRSRGPGSTAAGRSPGCTACATQSAAESWFLRQPVKQKQKKWGKVPDRVQYCVYIRSSVGYRNESLSFDIQY